MTIHSVGGVAVDNSLAVGVVDSGVAEGVAGSLVDSSLAADSSLAVGNS